MGEGLKRAFRAAAETRNGMNANEIINEIGKAIANMSTDDAEEFLLEILEDCKVRKDALKYD